MKHGIRMMAAAIAVLGAMGLAQAQGGGSGGAGGGAGGSGTPAPGNGTPGSGTGTSPGNSGGHSGGSNSGMSSGKSGATTDTGSPAGVRSTPSANGAMKSTGPAKHSHAKRAKSPTDPASVAPGSSAG